MELQTEIGQTPGSNFVHEAKTYNIALTELLEVHKEISYDENAEEVHTSRETENVEESVETV